MTSSVEFRDTQKGLSSTLSDFSSSLPKGGHITVRELVAMIGEQGMLFFCIILTIPFLTPIPLPGISTVFGLLIMLIAVGVILNRLPWMPPPLLNRPISSTQLSAVLNRGAQLFRGVERFIRPRMLALTRAGSTNRINGFVLFLAGFLLILPFPFIPISNFLPGWAVLFLAAGMLQRDGAFVLVGYVLVLVTFLYFGAIAVIVVAAGQGIGTLLTEPTLTPTPGLLLPLLEWLR